MTPQRARFLDNRWKLGLKSGGLGYTRMDYGKDRGPKKGWGEATRYYWAGTLMWTSVLVGAGIGYLLDRAFHTKTPWFILVFTLLGAVAGFKALFQAVSPPKSRRK